MNRRGLWALGLASACAGLISGRAKAQYYTPTVAGGASATFTSTQQAGSYTAALTDGNTVVEMTSASANNFTVPPNASVAFPVGTWLQVLQYGAGQTTIVAGGGVTLRTPSSLTTRAQYSTVVLRQRAANEWVVMGDLS